MVAGFETPTEGDIVLAGENIVARPPFERDINMVFQNLALFPHLTVAENIQYGLKQRGIPKDEREQRTEEMLEMVRLPGYGPRDPSELSGGEQQRVALARALVNEPALVLFDEPLSSLDRKLRQHMQTELQRIQSETGITFLYVTHDQEVALSVSDRLVVLNDGLVEQVDSVEALYEQPQSQFVADFIGDVNTVEATVVSADGALTVEAGGAERVLPGHDGFAPGDRVHVCVRPHDVSLAGDDDATFSTPGTVRTRSYQGSDTVYTVSTDQWGDIVADVRGSTFDVGDSVTVAWDGADVHVFANGDATDADADTDTDVEEAV
jgi:spermidine/putrescine transport system ATP-binding protein